MVTSNQTAEQEIRAKDKKAGKAQWIANNLPIATEQRKQQADEDQGDFANDAGALFQR